MINNFNFSVGDIGYPPKKKTLIPSTKLSDLFSDTITTVIPTDEYNHNSLYNKPTLQRETITGKKYNVPYGMSMDEVNKIIFGDEYVYHTGLKLGNSVVQGAAILSTGGTSTFLVQGGILAIKALSQAVVENQVNGKSVSTSLMYGGLGSIKLGALAAFKPGLKNAGRITSIVVETSDKWHHYADKWSFQTLPMMRQEYLNGKYKFDAIFTSFGLSQAEKRFATGKNVYKAFSPHKKSNDESISNADALHNSETNENYKNQNPTQKNIEKVASAQDRYLKKLNQNDPNRNIIGQKVDAFRAFSLMLDESILENKKYVMEYNNYQNDLLTKGSFTNKMEAATNLPFQIKLNVIAPFANVSNAIGSTLINTADELLRGFGEIINIGYVSAQSYLNVGGYTPEFEIVSVEHRDGKTTITKKQINRPNSEQSDVQKKINMIRNDVQKKINMIPNTKPKTIEEENKEVFQKNKEARIANDYLKTYGRPSVASILAIPNTPNKTNAFFKGNPTYSQIKK